MENTLTHKAIDPSIFNIRCWVQQTDAELLQQQGDALLAEAAFKVLHFTEHHFPVKGYTALWLLAESHLAVHTFPDGECSYIELSGCNETKTTKFLALLKATSLEIIKVEYLTTSGVNPVKKVN